MTEKQEDIAAAERAIEFILAWFTDPIYLGHYPASMVERLGQKLPLFSEVEIELIKGSTDFFGLNHYTTLFAAEAQGSGHKDPVYGNDGLSEDQNVQLSVDPSWNVTAMHWAVVP